MKFKNTCSWHLLTGVILLLGCPVHLSAQNDTAIIDGLRYQLNSKTGKATVLPLIDNPVYNTPAEQLYTSTEYTVPAKVTHNGAEYNVTEIDVKAFRFCKELKKINLPYGLKKIQSYAFAGSGLEDLYIPSTVDFLGQNVAGAINIYLRSSQVPKLDTGKDSYGYTRYLLPFPNETGLVIYVPEDLYNTYTNSSGPWFDNYKNRCKIEKYQIDGIWYNLDFDSHTAQVTHSQLYTSSGYDTRNSYKDSEYTIPAQVEKDGVSFKVKGIHECAFYQCENVNKVNLPEGLESIGRSAFDYCSNLTTFVIPGTVTHLGSSCLAATTALRQFTIPASVTEIETGVVKLFGQVITMKSATPPTVLPSVSSTGQKSYYAFATSPLPTSGTIMVPKGSRDAYVTALGWSVLSEYIFESEEEEESGIDPSKLVTVSLSHGRSNASTTLSVPKGSVVTMTIDPVEGYDHSVVFNGTTVNSDIKDGCYTTPALNADATLDLNHTVAAAPLTAPEIVSTNGDKPYIHTPILLTHPEDGDGQITMYYTKDFSVPDPSKAVEDPDRALGVSDRLRSDDDAAPAPAQGTFIYKGPFYVTTNGWYSGGQIPVSMIRTVAVRNKGTELETTSPESQAVYQSLTTAVSEVNSANGMKVTVCDGTITVDSAANAVTLYDATGHTCAICKPVNGTAQFQVNAGVYLVTDGVVTEKVTVN